MVIILLKRQFHSFNCVLFMKLMVKLYCFGIVDTQYTMHYCKLLILDPGVAPSLLRLGQFHGRPDGPDPG